MKTKTKMDPGVLAVWAVSLALWPWALLTSGTDRVLVVAFAAAMAVMLWVLRRRAARWVAAAAALVDAGEPDLGFDVGTEDGARQMIGAVAATGDVRVVGRLSDEGLDAVHTAIHHEPSDSHLSHLRDAVATEVSRRQTHARRPGAASVPTSD